MSTRLVWLVPTYYDIKSDSNLVFNFLSHSKQIINNKVWERKYSFGDTSSLKGLAPDDIKKAELTLFPYYWVAGPDSRAYSMIDDSVKLYFNINDDDFQNKVAMARIDFSVNIAVFDFEFVFDLDGVSNDPHEWKMEFIESYNRCFAIVKEIGALFRAACYLLFHCTFPIIPSFKTSGTGGGLLQICSKEKYYSTAEGTFEFTYPAIFVKEELSSFQTTINLLSRYWHLSLWPIFRYLKALSGTFIQMENFLDLLFSLEGLFDTNTSSEFIKLACSLLTTKTRAEAIHFQDILYWAYRMRNEVIHDGISYDGFEKIKIGGNEKISQTIFFNLRGIVAKMIAYALVKLSENRDMRNLRINFDDILDLQFPKK